MKIYIAGKYLCLSSSEAAKKFGEAEQMLRDLGWNPISPYSLKVDSNTGINEYLNQCLPQVLNCTAIYLLEDWDDCVESIIEHSYAVHHKLEMYFEKWYFKVPLLKAI